MSDYRVLQDISLHLRGLLFDGLTGDDEVGSSFTSESNISLASPAALSEGNADVVVSLYLYQVLPNPHLNNRALIPIGNDRQQFPPASLDLFYLLTPMSASPEEDLVVHTSTDFWNGGRRSHRRRPCRGADCYVD